MHKEVKKTILIPIRIYINKIMRARNKKNNNNSKSNNTIIQPNTSIKLEINTKEYKKDKKTKDKSNH